MSKLYGYARCSTNESRQNIHRQIKELKAAGAEEIVFEYEHRDAKVKEQLQALLEAAQPGIPSLQRRSAACPAARSSYAKS